MDLSASMEYSSSKHMFTTLFLPIEYFFWFFSKLCTKLNVYGVTMEQWCCSYNSVFQKSFWQWLNRTFKWHVLFFSWFFSTLNFYIKTNYSTWIKFLKTVNACLNKVYSLNTSYLKSIKLHRGMPGFFSVNIDFVGEKINGKEKSLTT